jgi:hypothetical protein
VDWFNNRRLVAPIGNNPPVERERAYYTQGETPAMAARSGHSEMCAMLNELGSHPAEEPQYTAQKKPTPPKGVAGFS